MNANRPRQALPFEIVAAQSEMSDYKNRLKCIGTWTGCCHEFDLGNFSR